MGTWLRMERYRFRAMPSEPINMQSGLGPALSRAAEAIVLAAEASRGRAAAVRSGR